MPISTDIVDADIPLLIGFYTLDKFGMNGLSVQNALESVPLGWRLPLTRKLGQLYLNPAPEHSILFTKAELPLCETRTRVPNLTSITLCI
jgi:hypothetical protein